jgi:glycosyltransferase involved in cell wall biosynthesis
MKLSTSITENRMSMRHANCGTYDMTEGRHVLRGSLSLAQRPWPGRVAIVHDWLVTYGGAERVLEQMLALFPDADLYSLVDFITPGNRDFVHNKSVTTSFIQRLPRAHTKYRSYLPLMPLAIERFDLSGYDTVISSSHAVAKGVITGPDQLHLCMCYSPMRYAWDLTHQYLRESNLTYGLKGFLAQWTLHRMRNWDARTANGVDEFIAISHYVARRIWKVYRREAQVIYPPVDTEKFSYCPKKQDFYLTVSRMVPYKRIDLIAEAFTNMPGKKLVIIGDGPDLEKVRSKASPNVTLLGYQSFEAMKDHMQRARAFVFAAEEDFGIVPVEAQACGTPVIAFGKGGALETVINGKTGLFFERQEVGNLIDAVLRFEQVRGEFDPLEIRNNALRFAPSRFRDELREFVGQAVERLSGVYRRPLRYAREEYQNEE